MKTLRILISMFFLCLAAVSVPVQAAVRMARLFSDGMVLQRHQPLHVWGWADAGQHVTVRLAAASGSRRAIRQAEAVADSTGRWQVTWEPLKAAGPLVLTAAGADETDVQQVTDVWVGDVWLCSGQSNVDVHVERVYPQYVDEIDRDSTRRVRLFKTQNVATLEGPESDVRSSGWTTLSKQSAWSFSALGYFLGKRMEAQTGVVQGIIQCSWGGTPIESWLPASEVQRFDERMSSEARYYADAELRRLIGAVNGRASQRWNELLEQIDPGVTGGWTRPDYDDSGWLSASQYHLPATPAWGFCGTYWLRQHVSIDAAHAGQPARLLLGTLVDADYTYVNGQQVGHTGYQYPPRRYSVPAGLLHEGDNVIAVRFVNRGQAPSFVREKPYQLVWADGSVQPLAEQWLVHDGTQMPSQPSMPAGYQNMAAAAFNGMLRPLAPYAVAGIVWYQGESNTGRPVIYEQQLKSLMASWRTCFGRPRLPFVIVQLANFMAPSQQPQNSGWAQLRESQRLAAQADADAALAVAIDLGEANDIHPLRKREVAERVGLAFDRLVFQRRVSLSPAPVSAVATTDGRVLVTFDQPVSDGEVHGFELSSADGKFSTVEKAVAHGREVTLMGHGNKVRYAWKDNPVEADVRAAASQLPAVPFQLDVTAN